MSQKLIRILALIKKEFLSIFKDPKSRALIITPPLLQLLVFAHAITMEVKNIDISILDYSKSNYSRELISRFSNSSWFRKVYFVNTKKEMKDDIDLKKSQIGIIIQNDLAKNIASKKPTEVLIIADGRQTNSASLASSYASNIISSYSSELQKTSSASVNVIIRNWFNPNIEYKWFLTVSLIVMLSMVLCLLLSALSIARERELGSFNQLLVSPLSHSEILISKTIPPLIVAFISSIIITLIIVFCFRVPFGGNIFLYLISTIVSLTSIVAIGLFISSFSYTQQQAILGVFAFQTPAVLLSGFVSPVEDMPLFFQKISLINPLRYYMLLNKGIYFKGMDSLTVLKALIPLIGISAIMFILARFSFKLKVDN
ncbi:MAG: ABC transporter permease [Cyanobacteria bacterium SIG27]|nr:ABC transporter permease [Cyanobacteria bacterium SIG27]